MVDDLIREMEEGKPLISVCDSLMQRLKRNKTLGYRYRISDNFLLSCNLCTSEEHKGTPHQKGVAKLS